MRIADLAVKCVAIWGCGREGRAALRALRARHPALALTVYCSAAEAAALSADDRDAELDIVTHAPDAGDLSAFDVVIKSPGISAYRAEILEARRNGTRFTSATALWFAENPHARVIAVTGTKGKSTVSALIAHLLRAAGLRVALAGNIGLPLLDVDAAVSPPDWWVVELSSFQTREAAHVAIAVIVNIDEEHLDWHGSRERYVADKLALAAAADHLLVNGAQPVLLQATATHAERTTFATRDGWHVDAGAIMRCDRCVFDLAKSPLPGAHNALNLCAALAACDLVGALTRADDASARAVTATSRAVDGDMIARAIATFAPLPHRLQTLGERDGIRWIDDSIATTPQATREALASVAGRAVCVLVGGHDRGLDWQPFAEHVRDRPPHAIVTMGASGARIHALLAACSGDYRLRAAGALDDAVAIARAETPLGGVVLLSPGAPSFDQFKDYAERGCMFARLAGFDADATATIAGLGIA